MRRARKERPTTPTSQRLHAYSRSVWADPLSLATTRGVSVDFLPRGTEMFQFPRLPPRPYVFRPGNAALPALGFPIRESTGQRLFNASPWLIAVVHALLRLQMPRHPPCALHILTVIQIDQTREAPSSNRWIVLPNLLLARARERARCVANCAVSQNSTAGDGREDVGQARSLMPAACRRPRTAAGRRSGRHLGITP